MWLLGLARARAIGWRAPVLGVVTAAELVLLLVMLVPVLGAATPLGQGGQAAPTAGGLSSQEGTP